MQDKEDSNEARHSSLAMTQRYIDCDIEAQKRVVQML